jgi:tellurite resistance protein
MVQHGRGAIVKTRQLLTTAASERAARSSAADLDATVMQALVTAGALVALSDGQVLAVERDELVDFIDGQAFAPSIPRHKIMESFCERVRKLDERYSPQLIMESFRPLAGLSLASIVVRVAHRVAAADGKIRPGEVRAIELIRSVMATLSGMRRHHVALGLNYQFH